jgi:hypothetical protein
LIVTVVPTVPLDGVKPLIAGATANELAVAAEPPGVVTEIGPDVAPLGTVAVIWVGETTAKEALVPAKVTPEAPENPLPEIVTVVPTVPLGGEKEVIETVATTVS